MLSIGRRRPLDCHRSFSLNYLQLTTWILSDNVINYFNFELPSVTVINRAAKFKSQFYVNSIDLLYY